MKDKQGRLYARISKVKVGDRLVVDGDFTCMTPWSTREVYESRNGLYVMCDDGKHYLSGVDDGRGNLVGLYKEGVKV